jgi:hypothetical protein
MQRLFRVTIDIRDELAHLLFLAAAGREGAEGLKLVRADLVKQSDNLVQQDLALHFRSSFRAG